MPRVVVGLAVLAVVRMLGLEEEHP